MNTPSNAMPVSQANARATASNEFSTTRPLYWSVQRELWENRYLYIAPLAVAAVFLIASLIGTIHLPTQIPPLPGAVAEDYRQSILIHYNLAAGFMMAMYILVTMFYCADALHSERRDRSILFWKSLPVSDLTTVLAKASIPFIILPLLTFAITLALQFMMLTLSSVVLLASGRSPAFLWANLPVLRMSMLFLYHIVTSHALWPAPVYCWLMLVSGWARRAAFLWAALPLLAIAGVEEMAFRTHHFASVVGERFIGASDPMSFTPANIFPTDPMTHIIPGEFFLSPSLWIGLAIAAAFLAAAVRLRRNQGPV